jgi:hypothetical protein
MHAYGGNIVSIGQRRIAELAHVDRRSARRSLESLARRGHISTALTKLLRRSVFQLNSPVFVQEPGDQLGGEMRPVLGVVARPRIDIERGGPREFPAARAMSRGIANRRKRSRAR